MARQMAQKSAAAAREADEAEAEGGVATAEKAAAPLDAKYGVGTVVYKIFQDKARDSERPFSGTVVGYRVLGGRGTPGEAASYYYRVAYEDGDEEELDELDMGRVFVYRTASPAATAADGSGDNGADVDDPLAVARYAADIHAHHRAAEACAAALPGCRTPSALDDGDRARTVDWLVATHARFRLLPETLHLAVHLADRYVAATAASTRPPPPRRAAAAALLLAAKYEEIYPPGAKEVARRAGDGLTVADLLDAEADALRALEHRLSFPTAHAFLPRLLGACGDGDSGGRLGDLCRFLLDATLRTAAGTRRLPSLRAAAAVYVARRSLLGAAEAWTPALAARAGYDVEDVSDAARDVLAAATRPGGAVFAKYNRPGTRRVARTPLCADM